MTSLEAIIDENMLASHHGYTPGHVTRGRSRYSHRHEHAHGERLVSNHRTKTGAHPRRLEMFAPVGFPLVSPGTPLLPLILKTLQENDLPLCNRDILVVTQKILSKSENRYVRLADVEASPRARELAAICNKDARMVEMVLRESDRIVRCTRDILIVRHRLGFVSANAGIDRSNIESGDTQILLLPENPDRSAAELRAGIHQSCGVDVGVLIIDSFGRPWRLGTCGVCIGSAGIVALNDYRGRTDLSRRRMEVTEVAQADEIAAAASILMGPSDQALPIVIVRGLDFGGTGRAADLIRPVEQDQFL
ncbi:coenzyme F420-0:L-glutamate ligase [Georgfuchsia toluolica]|nr:coenzyme F420-0:L-glutamate ligase [Georgfuchsia toluolica]